jgi:hypothetical protein
VSRSLPLAISYQIMELLFLGLPFATTCVMFVWKKIAALELFGNGAAAHPWLRVLLIVTSLFGVGSLALLNGTDVNPDSVSYLLELLVGTVANAYLSHSFYQQLRRQ